MERSTWWSREPGPSTREESVGPRSVAPHVLLEGAPAGSIPPSGMVLLAVLLLSPLTLAAVLHGSAYHRFAQAGEMAVLLQNVAVLGAAIVLRYEWQVSANAATGWLAVAVGFLAVQKLPFSLLLVAGSPIGEYGTESGVAVAATALLTVLLLRLGTARVPAPRPNPMTVAVGLGILVAVLRLAGAKSGVDPALDLSEPWRIALDVTAAALVGCIVAQLLRCRDLPGWFRRYVGVASVLLAVSAGPVPDSTAAGIASVLVGAGGVVLLLGGAFDLLRATLGSQTRRLVEMTTRTMRAEAAAREGHERAHELTATVAGIAHASRVLLMDRSSMPQERHRLVGLLRAELERLERMMGPGSGARDVDVEVDALVEPVVMVHRALGHDVTYTPVGLWVRVRADDLAQVIHILLSNAARHAPGARVAVVAEQRGGSLEIRVRDDGPGVAPSVAGRLFQWGGRRPESPGQGIGLQLARRIMRELGGDLRWEPTARGACFVAVVPMSPR